MAGLCEGGNEPSGSLKAIFNRGNKTGPTLVADFRALFTPEYDRLRSARERLVNKLQQTNSVKLAMWTAQQKVSCVLWLAEKTSVKHVQRRFRREYYLLRHDSIPDYTRMIVCDVKLKQTGSFSSSSVTGSTYLHMLELYVVPQLPAGTIYHQDGAPPHFVLEVRKFLNDNFPRQWIGRVRDSRLAAMVARSMTLGLFPMGIRQGLSMQSTNG
ncbi:hypothetical protein ANN_18281 [Periplaneta americana]|uniref:DUF4817 domain-containing protein n=1 Tax=Periplaneta americana TaxID=6978 RepID=A0ABQ8SPK0_PERAM|nr:hypothetical protein ANN_18281 [Periplaneta americana]